MKIGNYIKEKRLQKGLTQEDLALKCDITVRTIQRIESGEVDPRSYTLQAIASALEVDFQELLSVDAPSSIDNRPGNEGFWLAMVHFSSIVILIIPTVFIWALKRDKIPNIGTHAVDAVNFQLSMMMYLIAAAFFCLVPVTITFSKTVEIPVFMAVGMLALTVLGIYSSTLIIINTAKAVNHQPYSYPLSIKILKNNPETSKWEK